MLTHLEYVLFKGLDAIIDEHRDEVGFKLSTCAALFYLKLECALQEKLAQPQKIQDVTKEWIKVHNRNKTNNDSKQMQLTDAAY